MGPGAAPKSFMDNKPLSRAVFALSGIIGFVAIAVLVAFFIRRAKRKKLLRQAISFDPQVDFSTIDREEGSQRGGGSMDQYMHTEHGNPRGPGGSTEAIIGLLDGAGLGRNVDPFAQGPAYPQQARSAQPYPAREAYAYPGQAGPGQIPVAYSGQAGPGQIPVAYPGQGQIPVAYSGQAGPGQIPVSLQPGYVGSDPARFANPIFDPTSRGFPIPPPQQPGVNAPAMTQTSGGATLPGRNLIYQTSATAAQPDISDTNDDEMWTNAYVGLAADTPRVLRVANQ